MTPRDEFEERAFQRSSVPTSAPIQPNACARRGGNSIVHVPPPHAFSVPAWEPHPTWNLILGPPGCGKTQTLCARVRGHLEAGVLPEQIVCLSYSRAAKKELVGRVANVCHGLLSEPLQVRTIHGLAFRLLGMSVNRIMGEEHWREFAALYGYQFTELEKAQLNDDLEYQVPPRGTDDDLLRHAYEWGRNLGLSLAQTMARYQGGMLRVSEFEAFVRRYEAFKVSSCLCDFTDLLEDVLAEELHPGAHVFAIDEAQELSPLLLRVLHLWIAECEHVHFGADDDQSVHSFQGGDPRWLVELSQICTVTLLTQSWRVPVRVHGVAQAVISRNKLRIPKDYLPTQALGEVLRLDRERIYPLLDGSRSTFVLARNRYLLVPIAERLLEGFVPFVVEGGGAPSPLSDSKLLAAVGMAIALHRRDGERFPAASLAQLLVFVPNGGLASMETRSALNAAARAKKLLPLDDLVTNYGLGPLLARIDADGPFSCLERVPERARRYLAGLYARYGKLPEPRIALTSIHGAKGREADLVVVLPEMATKSYGQYLAKDHEEENRIFYVAVTRTRRTLVLVEPQTKKYFRFPKAETVRHSGACVGTSIDPRGEHHA